MALIQCGMLSGKGSLGAKGHRGGGLKGCIGVGHMGTGWDSKMKAAEKTKDPAAESPLQEC